jgi:hypothetical protein
VDAYPARQVAVLPDNPGIYPALELKNPFPVDWMIPLWIFHESPRILSSATALDRSGDYLVLFQTFAAADLAERQQLPRAGPGDAVYFESGGFLTREILSRLHGKKIYCGPFLGVYSSPHAPG